MEEMTGNGGRATLPRLHAGSRKSWPREGGRAAVERKERELDGGRERTEREIGSD